MKKIIILSAGLLLFVSFSFAQQKPAAKKSTPSEDTIQYSLGVYMMQQFFAKTGFVVNDQALFKKGVDDFLNNRKLMVDPLTTQARLLDYQHKFQVAKGMQYEKLLFDKVRAEKGYTALGSGVYYSVRQAGKGLTPSSKDTVVLNVICTLPDGTVVDDTQKNKQSYMALASDMLPGLRDVLFRVPEGSIFRAILPAATAYGEQGYAPGNIPPSSALIYDIAVVSVKPAK